MNKFKTYTDFSETTTSEKITLAHVHAKSYILTGFSVYSGNIYERSADHVVTEIKDNGAELTLANDKDSVISGTYFYEIETNKIYIYSADISSTKLLLTYRLFFSSAPLNLSYDLSYGHEVYYEPRLVSKTSYSVKTDSSAIGVALIGSGNLSLTNTDGELDNFGQLYFENQDINIYSYNRNIEEDQIKLIYSGIIVTKTYTDKDISFKINNKLDFINNLVSLKLYPDEDNISESLVDTYKSRPFGRVDGLQAQSISIVGEGFSMSGTVTGSAASSTLIGTSTQFLSELSPDDELTLSDGTIVSVSSITDNTTLVLSDELESDVNGATAEVEPSRPNPHYNRTWQVSGNALRKTISTIISVPFNNAVELDDSRDLEIGDIITTESGQNRVIDSISGNRIVVTQAFSPLPITGQTIVRTSIQNTHYLGKELDKDYYSINNNSIDGCQLVLDDDIEKTHFIRRGVDTSETWTVSSGSREISRDSGTNELLPELIKPRDYIKIGNSGLYEVLQVTEDKIHTRIPITSTYTNQYLQVVNVIGIDDDSIISCNVIGETIDGEPTGIWAKNASQVIKLLLIEQGLESLLNSSSFDDVSNNQDYTVSMVIPRNSGSNSSEKLKSIIGDITKSTLTSLVVNGDMKLALQLVDTSLNRDSIKTITEHDVIAWKYKTEQNALYNEIVCTYNEVQINKISLESGSSIVEFENELATDLGISKKQGLELSLYREKDANYVTQRYSMLTQSLNSVIEINTDLRYYNLELGDIACLDFETVSNFGDLDTNKRLMMVTSVKKDGERMIISFSDISNLFAKRAVITDDNINDYNISSDDEKLYNSWITEDNGIVDNNNDNTYGRNIII